VATLEDYSKIGDEYDDVSPSVTGAILSYAVTSARVEDGISDGAGKITDRSDEMLEKLTTYTKINENTPPCFIWHTANDEVVPVSHSLKFAMGLSEHNIPFELHIFPDGHHGLGLAKFYKDISKWPDLTVEWIQNNF
jgi:dipeptidyl aminopeptidase/acylaminoacyl peptidase